MLYFENDYSEGAHEAVLRRLIDTIWSSCRDTAMTDTARPRGKRSGRPAAVRRRRFIFRSGGTQTNAVVISAVLTQYEGVIAASTGHINGHEAGAVEYSGHRY